MYVFLRGILVLFLAPRKTAVLSSSRPVIAYSVWKLRGGSEWSKNVVAQFVEALRYKPAGRGFDSR